MSRHAGVENIRRNVQVLELAEKVRAAAERGRKTAEVVDELREDIGRLEEQTANARDDLRSAEDEAQAATDQLMVIASEMLELITDGDVSLVKEPDPRQPPPFDQPRTFDAEPQVGEMVRVVESAPGFEGHVGRSGLLVELEPGCPENLLYRVRFIDSCDELWVRKVEAA